MAYIDMTSEFTEEGIARLKEGNMVGFMQADGVRQDYKIMRIEDGRVFGKKIKTYLPDEIEVTEIDEAGDKITKSLTEFESEA